MMTALSGNAIRVLETLATSGAGFTRQQLVQDTRLSRPTIQGIVEQLAADEWILETHETNGADGDTPSSGRVPGVLRLAPRAGFVAGVDMGHGHIRVGIADANGALVPPEDPSVDEQRDVDTSGPEALATAISLLAARLETNGLEVGRVRGLTVGIPAPLTFDGRLASTLFLPGWTAVDVEGELRARLAAQFDEQTADRLPIFVENDANLGAYAEARHRGPGTANLLYVKASTGVGMGLLLGTEVFRGSTGVAGEFGHVAVPAAAQHLTGLTSDALPPPCPRCKKQDCLQNLASGSAIMRRLRRVDPALGDDLGISDVIDQALGRRADNFESSERPTVNAQFLRVLVHAGLCIGYALAEQVTQLNPSTIVLGGLLARGGDVVLAPIRDALTAHAIGLADVELQTLEEDRIELVELEGAVALALLRTSLPLA